jgi:hypothetical protein
MADSASAFSQLLGGRFHGIIRWQDLDALWQRTRIEPAGWYASLVGEPPPEAPLAPAQFEGLVGEIDALLRREHDEDYCGIVYVDDPSQPSLIKIYDPGNLGSSCGTHSGAHPPRWVLSRLRPEALHDSAPLPGGRKRWWQRILGQT